MESWFCIWDDLANPKIGLNLVPTRCSAGTLADMAPQNEIKLMGLL
jgi:hypothetical protein